MKKFTVVFDTTAAARGYFEGNIFEKSMKAGSVEEAKAKIKALIDTEDFWGAFYLVEILDENGESIAITHDYAHDAVDTVVWGAR